jgi:hypothetical protein
LMPGPKSHPCTSSHILPRLGVQFKLQFLFAGRYRGISDARGREAIAGWALNAGCPKRMVRVHPSKPAILGGQAGWKTRPGRSIFMDVVDQR